MCSEYYLHWVEKFDYNYSWIQFSEGFAVGCNTDTEFQVCTKCNSFSKTGEWTNLVTGLVVLGSYQVRTWNEHFNEWSVTAYAIWLWNRRTKNEMSTISIWMLNDYKTMCVGKLMTIFYECEWNLVVSLTECQCDFSCW